MATTRSEDRARTCPPPWRRWPVALALALAIGLGGGTVRAGDADVPLAVAGGFETWQLPAGERMGMAHLDVLFEVAPDWWLGPSIHGATTGRRGGFFVGALALQRAWPIGSRASLVTGLAVGGGGGAAAPVGDGLMIRPSLALLLPVDRWRLGLGLSQVWFPGTPIRSTQLGLVAQWRGEFRAEPLARLGQRVAVAGRSGIGFDRLSVIGGRHALRDATGSPDVDWVGIRLDRLGPAGLSWGITGTAAANGGRAGYMEGLAHAGLAWAVTDALEIGARAGIGFAGGGAVPSGSGAIAHLDATLRVALAHGLGLEAAVGRLAGRTAAMRGTRTEVALSTELEPVGAPGSAGRIGTARRVEWVGTLQHIGAMRRSDGSEQAMQTIGLQLAWWLGPHLHLSGHAHSAFGGGAGAYGQGLVGAGLATEPRGGDWQFGAELLAGAGGGGGVQGLAGAVTRATLWAGRLPAGDGAHLRLAVGAEAGRGGETSPLVALSWVVPFAQVGR